MKSQISIQKVLGLICFLLVFVAPPVSATNIAIGVRLIDLEADDATDVGVTWNSYNSLLSQEKCLIGIKINVPLEISNTSIAGGGPFTVSKLQASYSLPKGFSDSLLADEIQQTFVDELGKLEAGSSLNLLYSLVPIKRGMNTFSADISSELFDPIPSNNHAEYQCQTSGPEIKINGQTNNLSISSSKPISVSVSNDLDKAFVAKDQLLKYWLLFSFGDEIFSWTLTGFVPGIVPVGTFPLIHFEDVNIIDEVMLMPGNYQGLICVGSSKHELPQFGVDACDYIKLDVNI